MYDARQRSMWDGVYERSCWSESRVCVRKSWRFRWYEVRVGLDSAASRSGLDEGKRIFVVLLIVFNYESAWTISWIDSRRQPAW